SRCGAPPRATPVHVPSAPPRSVPRDEPLGRPRRRTCRRWRTFAGRTSRRTIAASSAPTGPAPAPNGGSPPAPAPCPPSPPGGRRAPASPWPLLPPRVRKTNPCSAIDATNGLRGARANGREGRSRDGGRGATGGHRLLVAAAGRRGSAGGQRQHPSPARRTNQRPGRDLTTASEGRGNPL